MPLIELLERCVILRHRGDELRVGWSSHPRSRFGSSFLYCAQTTERNMLRGRFFRDLADASVEAGAFAGVTGRTLLVDASQEDVAVAVGAELFPMLNVARRVALSPELLPGSAPVDHPPLLERPTERIPVGPREHQDVAVLDVLDHHRDQ